MHKNAMKCNETLSKWCKNKPGASKIIDTFETYQAPSGARPEAASSCSPTRLMKKAMSPSTRIEKQAKDADGSEFTL
jgi:hypothetical protein